METKKIPYNKIKKFFDILNKMGRQCSELYGGHLCEKQVFVNRYSDKLFKNKPNVLLSKLSTIKEKYGISISFSNNTACEMLMPENYIVNISSISYVLGYGDKICIKCTDIISSKILNVFSNVSHNDAMNLNYKIFTDAEMNTINSVKAIMSIPREKTTLYKISGGKKTAELEKIISNIGVQYTDVIKFANKSLETFFVDIDGDLHFEHQIEKCPSEYEIKELL